MKTLLSFLLLPLLIYAQPDNFSQAEFIEIQFSVALNDHKMTEIENMPDMVEVLVTVEVFYREYASPQIDPARNIPKHLNSLSLAGFYQHTDPTQKYQKRLNGLLAVNDINRPAERSLTNWLKTVPLESKMVALAQYIPEGFGARISL